MSNAKKTQTPEELAAAEAAAKAEAEAKAKEAAAGKNVSVTFTKPWSRYSRGDIAGFPADRAKQLVEGVKVAVSGTKLPEAPKAE